MKITPDCRGRNNYNTLAAHKLRILLVYTRIMHGQVVVTTAFTKFKNFATLCLRPHVDI